MKRGTRSFTFEIDNSNLKRALELRQEGNPEARVWLERACAEGDAKALYYKACAVNRGGFFYEMEKDSHTKSFLKASAEAGCPWAMVDYGHWSGEHAWFEKALESGDNYAYAHCYFFGHGIEKNKELGREYLKKAEREGNCLVYADTHDFLSDETEIMKWLEKGAEHGDPAVQFRLSRELEMSGKRGTVSSNMLHRAAAQCFYNSYWFLGFNCVHYDNLPKLAAKWYVKGRSIGFIRERIRNPDITNGEMFVYGQAFKRDVILSFNVVIQNEDDHFCDNAIRVYEQSTDSARRASLCFIWAFRGNPFLNRDVVRMIAQMVFKSREEETSVWL